MSLVEDHLARLHNEIDGMLFLLLEELCETVDPNHHCGGPLPENPIPSFSGDIDDQKWTEIWKSSIRERTWPRSDIHRANQLRMWAYQLERSDFLKDTEPAWIEPWRARAMAQYPSVIQRTLLVCSTYIDTAEADFSVRELTNKLQGAEVLVRAQEGAKSSVPLASIPEESDVLAQSLVGPAGIMASGTYSLLWDIQRTLHDDAATE